MAFEVNGMVTNVKTWDFLSAFTYHKYQILIFLSGKEWDRCVDMIVVAMCKNTALYACENTGLSFLKWT